MLSPALRYARKNNGVLFEPDANTVLWLPGQDDAPSATIRDRSGNNNNGTITGATWVQNSWGLWGLSFDGVDDKITISHSASTMFTTNATWKLWIKFDGTGNQMLVCKYQTYNQEGYYINYYSNVLTFVCGNAGAIPRIESNSDPFVADTWYLLHIVKSGTTGTFYKNGAVEASTGLGGDLPDIVANTEDTLIGLDPDDGQDLGGDIGLFYMRNTNISATQALSVFNQERHLFGV